MKGPDEGQSPISAFFDKIGALSRVQRIIISVAVVVLVIGAFVGLSYLPKFTQLNELNDEIDGIDQKLAVAKTKAAKIDEMRKQMASVERDYKEGLQLLPDKKEIPALLAGISESGKEAHLEFILFQPQDESAKEAFAEMPVKLEVRGSYHDLAVFFDKVSKLFRIVNIRNVKITPRKKVMSTRGKDKPVARDEGNLLSASMDAVTYRFISEAEAGADDKKR